ncbi:uncharacterized protein LOC141915003 [Tubulanus polymorphus]|uniref:uncharacterized protein LOC141915003 n=1 Tax=Tubulanus polymorphus TaxID=672921 RepID=UPI003DA35E1C
MNRFIKYQQFIGFLVIFITSVECRRFRHHNSVLRCKDRNLDECPTYDGREPQCFNRQTQFCCKSVVYEEYVQKNGKGFHRGCCGGKLVENVDSQLCCKGRIVHNANPYTTKCCPYTAEDASELYDPNISICCADRNIYDRYDSNGTETICCGAKQQINGRQECCRNKNPYDPYTQFCEEVDGTVHNSNQAQCGTRTYNPFDRSCCAGHLTDFPKVSRKKNGKIVVKRSSCCGSTNIHPDREICCEGKYPFPRSGIYQCCRGAKTHNINPQKQLCCGGVPFNLDPNLNECCGSKTYNKKLQGCCVGQIYNKKEQKCALRNERGDNRVVVSVDSVLCDGVVQADNQLCCGGYALINKSKRTHNSCCLNSKYNEFHTYDNSTHICADEIYDISESQRFEKCISEFGGWEWMNPDVHLCCNGGRFRKTEPNYNKCCAYSTYNIRTETCCNGMIGDIPERLAVCCKNGEVQLKRNRTSECIPDTFIRCNNTWIDPLVTVCCQGTPRSRDSGDRCCGSVFYNGSLFACCANKNKFNTVYQCCNSDTGAVSAIPCYKTEAYFDRLSNTAFIRASNVTVVLCLFFVFVISVSILSDSN